MSFIEWLLGETPVHNLDFAAFLDRLASLEEQAVDVEARLRKLEAERRGRAGGGVEGWWLTKTPASLRHECGCTTAGRDAHCCRDHPEVPATATPPKAPESGGRCCP